MFVYICIGFVFTNKQQRLNYFVGGELFNIAHLSKQLFLLGYLAKEGRLYLSDKDMNVVSYKLQTAIINYQTAILRGDLDAAERFLPKIPDGDRNRVAQFLEGQGLKVILVSFLFFYLRKKNMRQRQIYKRKKKQKQSRRFIYVSFV